jgi:hypothetical protein
MRGDSHRRCDGYLASLNGRLFHHTSGRAVSCDGEHSQGGR